MIFYKKFLYVIFPLALLSMPSMHGVTVFGYSFEVPLASRISALYNSAYTYLVANCQAPIEQNADGRQPANIRLNDQAAQRAARILGHIAPEDHSSVVSVPCNGSSVQRASRILGHIAPESSSRSSTNVYPVATSGAYVPTQSSHDRQSTQRISRILGHIAPTDDAKSIPIAVQSTAAHSNPEVQRAVENFVQTDLNTLLALMNQYPEAAKAFVKPAVDNFAQTGSYILCKIADRDSKTVEALVQYAVDNFTKVNPVVLATIMNCYPKVGEAFVKCAVENFVQTHPYILRKIMDHYPKVGEAFVKCAVDNFVQTGPYMVCEIMDRYPKAVEAFVKPVVDNFARTGPYMLRKIMNRYPKAAEAFVKHAVDNFAQTDRDVLCKIMDHYPKAVEVFVKPAVENFVQTGPYVLRKIMDCYPKAAEAFVKPALENFAKVDPVFLVTIMDRYPKAVEAFMKCAVENFVQTDPYILCKIMDHYPKAAEVFVKPAADNFAQTDLSVLKKIMDCYPEAKLHFESQVKPHLPYIFDVTYMTQTQQLVKMHYIEAYKTLSNTGHVNYQDYPALQDMTKRVIELEHQEQEKGRYTFVHGHLWRYHFSQEMYTDLWKIVHGPADRFRHVRYKNPAQLSIENFFSYIKQEQERREQLMNDSVNQYYTSTGNQDYLLFMNYALFCNYQGSNTACYIKENVSENPVNIDCDAFLKELQLDRYVTTDELEYIAKKCKELEQEHKTITEYGGGLLLSFTPEMLKKCVYPCHGGGAKRTVEIAGIGETADPQVILDTLRTAPEKIKGSDRMEFACVLTHDCALIPNNGLDIYEFNAADQEKLAAWRAKKDELMAWIQKRVDSKREAQMQARL